jgi:putative transposase
MERIAPSARLEAQIDELLSSGLSEDGEHLAELGRLGARLVLQRAVEEEVTAFLGRARYARTPTATGSRNGTRPKPIHTAEGEISIAMPQVRGTAEQFVSRVIPDTKAIVRTRPLEALIIGSYVRGLSDRDIESLAEEAGLGQVSKTTVSRICRELRDRYRAFCSKSLAEISLLVLFLDAVYLPTRPSGDKEGVLVAWGYTTLGKRVLVSVRLGQRESHEDWLDLGRDLARRGLRSPWLVVSDGAPGLIKAIEQLWPEADRGRCAVHKLRNIVAKLPDRPGLHQELKDTYLGGPR